VTEQRAHKRIDANPFAREAGAGYGQGAASTRETHPSENKHPRTMKRPKAHPPEKKAAALPPSLATILPDA